jgi:hypothetical protein
MARRQKPLGKEKWTWDEINRGRRWTGNERKWRKRGKQCGWAQTPDGSYQMPPGAALIYIGVFVALIVLYAVLGLK